jgi:hypothetical protein
MSVCICASVSFDVSRRENELTGYTNCTRSIVVAAYISTANVCDTVPTECINVFRTLLRTDMVPLNSINLETQCVFCEHGKEFLKII